MESVLNFLTSSETDEKVLDTTIEKTQDLNLLNVLLDVKLKKTSSTQNKVKLILKHIYESETEDINLVCSVLKKALLVSTELDEQLCELACYFRNKWQSLNNEVKLIKFLNILLPLYSQENKQDIIWKELQPENITTFLLGASDKDKTMPQALESLLIHFIMLPLEQQVICFNMIFEFSQTHRNLDIFCAVLNQTKDELVAKQECVLNTDDFWIYLEKCLSGTDSNVQKQAAFVLQKCVAMLRSANSYNQYILSAEDQQDSWEIFFILLDIGKEKQLHLIEPSLELFRYIINLHNLWQKCIYKIFLGHSQNSVVYKVGIYALQQNYQPNTLRDFLKILLPAINQNEYSDLSCTMFSQIGSFCCNLKNTEFKIFLEEILLVLWNPVSLWKVLQNVLAKDNGKQVYIEYFQDIIGCVVHLPHNYIRTECIRFLINIFWDKRSFFKMYMIACGLHKHGIDFESYCKHLEVADEILDFVMNELLSFNDEDGDFYKIIICFMFLTKLSYDVLSSPLGKHLHKLSPHLKLYVYVNYFETFALKDDQDTFNAWMEYFVMEYYNEFLNEHTIEAFLELSKRYLLFAQTKYPKNAVLETVSAVKHPEGYSKEQIYIAFALLNEFGFIFFNEEIMENNVLTTWRSTIVNEKDSRICKVYIELAIKELTGEDEIDATLNFLTAMLENHSNDVIESTISFCKSLWCRHNLPQQIIAFFHICEQHLKSLKKDRHYKSIVNHLIQIKYCYSENSSTINNDFLQWLETCPDIRFYLMKELWYMNCEPRERSKEFLMSTTIDMYLQGIISTKDKRTEYNICQDILQQNQSSKEPNMTFKLNENSSPNLLNAASRFFAFETLLDLAATDQETADSIMECLTEKYQKYFNKRYFPDSEIHYQKLRIAQLLLMLVAYKEPCNKQARQLGIFILDCFLEETNQSCVRQTLQWVFILLLKDCAEAGFEYISRILSALTPAPPSVITTLLPVLYHITSFIPEKRICDVIKLILPWTMGAHFKIRVYSQDIIKRLLKDAKNKHYKTILKKYEYLENAIDTCIVSSDAAFDAALKTDLLFLNDLDPIHDHSFKAILCDIPRLNKVSSTEWESISLYLSSKLPENLFKKIPIEPLGRKFSEAVDSYLSKENETTKLQQTNTHLPPSVNIQKKITTPWKTTFENKDAKAKSDFILIASLLEKPQNLGGLARTCEVFGVRILVFHDAKVINYKDFRSLSMSSESWIDITEVKVKDLKDFIRKCQKEGYCVIGAEQTACSRKLNEFEFPRKTALILGNEKEGISPDLIPFLNVCLEIPQFGETRSLNVHVAGATFIWEYAKQHLVRV